ncbi:phosphoglycolate phosphatase [Thiothrix winogradskyi]|uniref:Phosphoglycolate phosphatase n=1 Tax=Thiothrix winogradskyi TaxID=96472 RepID=A0ABY3SW83_9GAMM|nr:phosphoglycolate phosphatase [Thiothrix winogradskyi]UJS23671.1 phosphoglycolate phosphatase [Thiothrix winogradskyi]
MFKPKMVLIDVDGTLVDSVPDLTFCVDEMLKQLDMPVRGEAAVRQWVGNGVQRLTERALTNDLDGYPDAELFARAMPIFMELYAENTSKRSRLYDGVLEGLDFLQSCEGLKIGCVTNKAEQFTLPLLTDLGIVDRFEIIISGDSLPEKKPHPLPLLHAAEKLGVQPEDSVMIGDSKSDVKAARAAGFQIICMTYGYNHGEDIRNYSPDAVIDSMTELANLISA